MHPSLLDILRCPESGAPLRLENARTRPNGMVVSGDLVSDFGRRYPIIRGVPRFVEKENYAASFGYEWRRWPRVQFESENVGRPMAGHTTGMWEKCTASEDRDLKGRTLVEFGCGSGRFLDVIRRKGARAVGVEVTAAADPARANFPDDPDVLIVQADIFRPPFRPGAFDGGYCIGVLHHTPDPAAGVKCLAECVKPGGWVAVSVYGRGGFYAYPSVARMRRLSQRLKPFAGYWPALAYAWFSGYLLSPAFAAGKRVHPLKHWLDVAEQGRLPCLDLPDARWRVLDIFDAITPAIASTHTGDEVRAWMEQAGCSGVRRTAWGETSLVGARAT